MIAIILKYKFAHLKIKIIEHPRYEKTINYTNVVYR